MAVWFYLVTCTTCLYLYMLTHALGATDSYGITEIYASASSGVDYQPNWSNQDRTISAVATDTYSTNDACVARGSNAEFVIDASTGIMSVSGNTPRYYCVVDHTNVEVTAYGKRGTESASKSYQGLTVVARSRHNDYTDDYCMARGYYFRLYNSGKACFLKEFIHSDDCLVYASGNPCVDISALTKGVWYGIKFVIRNDGNVVHLEGYMDYDGGSNGGAWQKILEYDDDGNWLADVASNEQGCMNTCGYNGDEMWLTEGNSVFLRIDYGNNYQWKWFSIREIDALTESTDDAGNAGGSIKVTVKSSSSKWWLAFILSEIPDGVTVTALKVRGNGMSSWESGVEESYGWVFTASKPYEGPFDFKVIANGETYTAYDLIQVISAGQSGYVSLNAAYTADEDTNTDTKSTNWVLVLAAISVGMTVCLVGIGAAIYCIKRRQRKRGDVSFNHESGVKELDMDDASMDVTGSNAKTHTLAEKKEETETEEREVEMDVLEDSEDDNENDD